MAGSFVGKVFARIPTDHGEFSVRHFEERDIPFIEKYYYESDPDYLRGIGFDPDNFETREDFYKTRRNLLEKAVEQNMLRLMVAEVNGQTISMSGFDSADNYDDGIDRMHFHILTDRYRGKGLGGKILRACILAYADFYQKDVFHIEPKHSNVPMNRLMVKMGFELLGQQTRKLRAATLKNLVNEYRIDISKLRVLEL